MSMQEIAPTREYVPKPDSIWTAEKVADLHRLIAEGRRGKVLQQMLGCSMPALYGKIRTLGILMREQPAHRRKPGRRQRNGFWSFSVDPTAATPPGVMDLASEPSDAAMSLADLDNTRCHWPISGAGLDMMFCGERSNECGPYCARHHSIAYRGKRQG